MRDREGGKREVERGGGMERGIERERGVVYQTAESSGGFNLNPDLTSEIRI